VSGVDQRPRDDASLGLLRSIASGALDPDYEAASHRRGGRGSGDGPPARRRALVVVLLLVIVALLVAGALALRRDDASQALQRDALRQRVDAAVVASDAQQARVDALRAEVERLRRAAGASGSAPGALLVVSGAVPVAGPGVRITLEDAAPERRSADPRLGRVLDVDLQGVVNGLWASGAEAVAVNGQRVTSLTAIRSAGEAILVNYRPLVPPYRVEAIGDGRELAARFASSPAGRGLDAAVAGYGLRVQTEPLDRLALPAGPTQVSTARPAPQARATGGAS
jgi:uncharacterized protein YlxW (UPF0749 family)